MKYCLRNIFRFIFNIIKQITISTVQRTDLLGIYNYYKIPNLYETSGQPNKQQLKLLSKKDYKVVINLAPSAIVKGRILNEEEILKSQKVNYIHIPVDFNNPTKSDFKKFVLNIEKYKNEKIWVHCAANMRVSAFTYKYRRDILNLDHDEIIDDLKAIWIPNKVWKSFLKLENVEN